VKILQSAFCNLHFALLVASLYKYGINLWIFLASLADTIPACRSRRFRFLPLPERRWPLKPLARLIFPVAVTLNLFTAPLLLFIFGTFSSFGQCKMQIAKFKIFIFHFAFFNLQ